MQYLAIEWIRAFKKAPYLTGVLSSIIAVIISFGIAYVDKIDKQTREGTRLENLNYKTQIEQLDQTENGIKQLLSFIDLQKQNIREAEDTVSSLKKEREALKPLVESDKAVVEAIFQAQEKRSEVDGVVKTIFLSFLDAVPEEERLAE
jgi:vacuolar-type H+-ATPase subunit I/STV1